MFSFFTKLIPGKGWLIIAFGALVISSLALGKLLLTSHEQNGVLSEQLTRLNSVNRELANAHDKRVAEYYELEEKMQKREVAKEQSTTTTNKIRQEIKEVKDENNIRDVVVPDDYWLLLERGARGE